MVIVLVTRVRLCDIVRDGGRVGVGVSVCVCMCVCVIIAGMRREPRCRDGLPVFICASIDRDFALEPKQDGACLDYVQISTNTFCGKTAPSGVHLDHQFFTVMFKSNEVNEYKGFKLEYEATYQDCEYREADNGSPNIMFSQWVRFLGMFP